MIAQHPGHHRHSPRYYILVTALVVAGIFLVLLMNERTGGFSFTSAVIGSSTDKVVETATSFNDDVLEEKVSTTTKKKISSNEVPFKLTFNNVPEVRKEADLGELMLTFKDLSTPIKINDDDLKLNNVEEVTLVIKDFSGKFGFDNFDISLSGEAEKIEINGVSLSSANSDLEISFENLIYDSLEIAEIVLEDLDFPAGEGVLTVSEKLNYNLEDEKVSVGSFNGGMVIAQSDKAHLEMEGLAGDIFLSGELLTLSLS